MLFLLFVLALFLTYLFAEMTKIVIVIEKREPFAGVSTNPEKTQSRFFVACGPQDDTGVRFSTFSCPMPPISVRTAS